MNTVSYLPLLRSFSSFANLSSDSKMADLYVTFCGNRREFENIRNMLNKPCCNYKVAK